MWGVRVGLYHLANLLIIDSPSYRTVSFLLACCSMFFQGRGILTYSMIGWVCFILTVLILWSIVASWEEVAEDKPVPPVPELQEEVNGPINIISHAQHGDVNSLRLANSLQSPYHDLRNSERLSDRPSTVA